MTEEINKFDALAYAVSKLGPPREISENRFAEASLGLVTEEHLWSLPCGRWLEVDEWSDGDQTTAAGAGAANWDDPIAIRDSDDGGLCPDYEEQARALIDAFAEGAR